jgi:hypothetical protein
MLIRLIRQYIGAIWKDWISRMSSIASLTLVVLALVFRLTELGQARYWIAAAMACYVVASFVAWKTERTTIDKLEGEIASLKEAIKGLSEGIEGLSQAEGVVSLTPQDLTGIYKGRTNLQGEKLAATHIGKWITVSGAVEDVRNSGKGVIVAFELERDHPLIMMYFEEQFIEPVSALTKGNKVTVRGRITKIEVNTLVLSGCELVKF